MRCPFPELGSLHSRSRQVRRVVANVPVFPRPLSRRFPRTSPYGGQFLRLRSRASTPLRPNRASIPIRSNGPQSCGMRSANHRGRKMSETRPLSAPRCSTRSVSGHRPRFATKMATSARAAARAARVHRDGPFQTPATKMCRTAAEFRRKIAEWTSLMPMMARFRHVARGGAPPEHAIPGGGEQDIIGAIMGGLPPMNRAGRWPAKSRPGRTRSCCRFRATS